MGCDIHAYIEYRDSDLWWQFCEPDLHRNYALFYILAGVRGYGSESDHFEPKGIPKDIGWQTKDKYTIWVLGKDEKRDKDCSCNIIDLETAKKWVENGYSEWWGDRERVTNPDWHTPSWLSFDELKEAYKRYILWIVEENENREDFLDEDPYDRISDNGVVSISDLNKITQIEPIEKKPSAVNIKKIDQEFRLSTLEATIAAMEMLEQGNNETRLVFWFDN